MHSRILTTYHDFEPCLKPDLNYVFDLSYLAILQLQGEKAVDFLQGQITADVRKISTNRMIPAALCNLQGRILTLMQVIQWHQDLLLILPQDLLEKTQSALNKPALLSRVQLKQHTQLKLFGFYLQNPADILPVQTNFPKELYAQVSTLEYCFYHLGQGFYIFVIHPDQEEEFCKRFKEVNQLLGSSTWHALSLLRHQIDIYIETCGMFLPHRLNLQHTETLAFDKGCYKGQEVIARMHYRAVLKHELKLFTIKTAEKIFLGQKLMKDGAEIGELVDYAPLNDQEVLIAVSILKDTPSEVLFEEHQCPTLLSEQNHASLLPSLRTQ